MNARRPPAAHGIAPSCDAPEIRALDCRQVVARFWDYLDGRCPSEVAQRIDAHVALCISCQRLRRFENRFLDLIGEVRRRSPAPRRLHDRVCRALAAQRHAD